jgi:hypothetical protein
MPPMTTYDLVLNFLIVVIMPVLIWSNLRESGFKSPLSAYLWNEHANFMRVSLLILGLLTLYSAVDLLGYYGLVSASVVEYAVPVIGIPFLIVAVAEIWLGVSALRKYLRMRKAGGTIT